MNDIDCTMSDFVLSALCFYLAARLVKTVQQSSSAKTWYAYFFIAVGLSAFFGAIYHGFLEHHEVWSTRIDVLLMLLTGLCSLCAWCFGARLAFNDNISRWVVAAAFINYAVYTAVILFYSSNFLIAIANYLPASAFLMWVFAKLWLKDGREGAKISLLGNLLIITAAGQQQSGLGFHPDYFDHNTVYHTLQGIAIFLIYSGATALLIGQNKQA